MHLHVHYCNTHVVVDLWLFIYALITRGCRTCLAKNCNKSSEFVDNVSNKLNDFDNMHCINNIITHIYWFFMNNVLITDVQLYGIVLHMNMVLPSLRQCHKVGAAIVTM